MMKAPLVFRLYQSVRFNRPVNKQKDFMSPGGYVLRVKDEDGSEKTVTFDFEDYEGSVDKDNPSVIHCVQKNPDYSCYEDLNIVNEHMLRNIVSVEDWFIYTGEPEDVEDDEEPLKPVEVLEAGFEIIPEKGNTIQIPITAKITPTCNF